MYLIIEGHSKVKTYGQGDEEGMHAPKIVPVKPTEEAVVTHVGEEEMPMVKHLHKKAPLMKEEKKVKGAGEGKEKKAKGGDGGLLSFIDSSLGDFFKGGMGESGEEDREEVNQVLEESVQKKGNQ